MKKGIVTPISSLFPAEEAHKASKRVQDTIAERQEQLVQLKGFVNANTNLINLLQKLPDELHHNIMILLHPKKEKVLVFVYVFADSVFFVGEQVPFGKVAFFPGRLIHTNELMILLGVDHYVERTSKQTIDILSRRGRGLENQLESLKAVIQDLKAEASFFDTTASEAVDGLVEVREDYVEESPPEVVSLANGSSHGKGLALNDSSSKNKALELPEATEKVQAPVMADHKVSWLSSIPGSDSNKAFTGSIVEHALDFGIHSAEQTGARSSKPVLRFKMQRK